MALSRRPSTSLRFLRPDEVLSSGFLQAAIPRATTNTIGTISRTTSSVTHACVIYIYVF